MKRKKQMRRREFIKPLNDKCPFCVAKKNPDYKDSEELAKYLSGRKRILSTERSGVCAKHQRKLETAIKRARFLGLLPFVEKV